MPNIFRPHRGPSSIMSTTKKDMILENGELFVEYPDNITDNNQYKIKIGNGVDTYENLKYAIDPAKVTDNINDTNTILGAKNLLPNNAVSATMNGVTFTVNSDGSVLVNGTSTVAFSFNIFDENSPNFEDIVKRNFLNKKLIVSGCPEGGTRETYSINLYRVGSVDGSDVTISERGSGAEFTWLNDLTGIKPIVRILIRENVTLNNLIFHPMIRLASITDDTYAPYTMTNRELTTNLLKITVKDVTVSSTVTAEQPIIIGNLETLTGGIIKTYNSCLGVMLITAKGQNSYDTKATATVIDTGDVVVTPSITQGPIIFRIAFLYF